MVYVTVTPTEIDIRGDTCRHEIVAKFSVSGTRPHGCVLVEPARQLIEEYGIIVVHTLVDTSSGSGSVLIVNQNAEIVVLPGLTFIGNLVPVAAISVVMEDTGPPVHDPDELPEEIVKGSHPSLGEPGKQLLQDLLLPNRHVFPAPGEPVTGRTLTVQHDIDTTDARLVCCGPRRLAPAGFRKEQTCVKEMFEGGQIEHSDSPWASPMVLVTKKDRSTRFCRLNAPTSFGLRNAPATFERLMDRVLCGMRWSRCLVMSFGGSVTEALVRLEEVLCRLSNFGLQLKAKKCTLMQTEVVFLGHIVGRTGLPCDPAKLVAVRNWHVPDKVKGVRRFVGFVGYYRRFVKDFAELAEPLHSPQPKMRIIDIRDRQLVRFLNSVFCTSCKNGGFR